MRKFIFIFCTTVFLFLNCNRSISEKETNQSATDVQRPENATAELISGNHRYVEGKSIAFKTLNMGREKSAKKQTPYAIVVSCSDSRVPPEEIFDVGIGEIFVVRSAGHALDSIGIGSIEYAAEHLGVKLVIVLGHERCGAVTATVKGAEVSGHISSIVDQIKPAVNSTSNNEGDKVDNAAKANVSLVIKKITSSKPVLKDLCEKGELTVVGAYYDLDDGIVEFFE